MNIWDCDKKIDLKTCATEFLDTQNTIVDTIIEFYKNCKKPKVIIFIGIFNIKLLSL